MFKKSLVVSCQALEEEPLHSSYIMGKMALAALEGGAKGIRANSVEDIKEIKKNVDLPIIGIIKKDYPNSETYITPTIREIDLLVEGDVDIIAVDATSSTRPYGQSLDEYYKEIRKQYPNLRLMADCSNEDEMINADRLGFDFIGTTLVGYTSQSSNIKIEDNDFELLRNVLKKIKRPIIAEGNIDTPEKAKRVLELGCYAVVVGGAITRPQQITKKFTEKILEMGRK